MECLEGAPGTKIQLMWHLEVQAYERNCLPNCCWCLSVSCMGLGQLEETPKACGGSSALRMLLWETNPFFPASLWSSLFPSPSLLYLLPECFYWNPRLCPGVLRLVELSGSRVSGVRSGVEPPPSRQTAPVHRAGTLAVWVCCRVQPILALFLIPGTSLPASL